MASVEASVGHSHDHGCPDLFRSILGVSIAGIFADSSLCRCSGGTQHAPDALWNCCGDDDVPSDVGMLLADQDEDCQFRNPGGLQVFGLHAEIQLFPQGRAQPRVDELPKLQFPGHFFAHPCHDVPLRSQLLQQLPWGKGCRTMRSGIPSRKGAGDDRGFETPS